MYVEIGFPLNLYRQEYYQELLDTFKRLKSSDVWKTLEDHWKLYQKKYWNKVDDQDENLFCPRRRV